MAYDCNPIQNDSSVDICAKFESLKNSIGEVDFNKYITLKFEASKQIFKNSDLENKWTFVGCVIIGLQNNYTISQKNIILAIQYVEDIIYDFKTDNRMKWFIEKVNIYTFYNTLTFLKIFE